MKETLGNVKSTRFCVTVVGSSAVGKTALTVQYLTGRFIGEYYTGSDMTYRHTVPYFGGSLSTHVDILDISRTDNELDELVPWTERTGAFLIVYSLTNARSFERAKEILSQLPPQAPKYLAANQLDLQHRRQVTREDGQNLADRYGCPFDEFSAAETNKDGPHNVKIAFQKLIKQLVTHAYVLPCPRIRFSAFSKLLGSIVSKTRHHTSEHSGKLQRGLSSGSTCSKCSTSSKQSTRSSSSDSSSVSGSDSSLVEIVQHSSSRLSPHIGARRHPANNKCTLPIPILFRRDSCSKAQVASI